MLSCTCKHVETPSSLRMLPLRCEPHGECGLFARISALHWCILKHSNVSSLYGLKMMKPVCCLHVARDRAAACVRIAAVCSNKRIHDDETDADRTYRDERIFVTAFACLFFLNHPCPVPFALNSSTSAPTSRATSRMQRNAARNEANEHKCRVITDPTRSFAFWEFWQRRGNCRHSRSWTRLDAGHPGHSLHSSRSARSHAGLQGRSPVQPD